MISLVCEYCNKKFERYKKQQTCSRTCSDALRTVKNTETRSCVCGVDFIVQKSDRKKYCTFECSSKQRSMEVIQPWLDGDWDGTDKYGLSYAVSRYLKREASWKCQSETCCVPGGWGEVNPTTGKVPVEIDHIDGNSFNNSKENLIVLCPNCHALTPTYKALNKNSGRTYRSRYKQYE